MSNVPGAEDPRLFDLWTQLVSDLEQGSLPPLEHYLARFPGLQADVEREYRNATARLHDVAKEQSESGSTSALSAATTTRQLLERLVRHPARPQRYDLKDELGRGGMGVVHKVFDGDLRRSIAMKVLRRNNERAVAAFLDEAQITGKLDHPGIVPVHELGIDEAGSVFFTMRLVRGRTLAEVFRLVGEHDEQWTETRALNALLRVCEAMAYAHSRRVIHRDLKPTNVMCGEFGEVYVMDWGVARVLGADGQKTHKALVDRALLASSIHTTLSDELESTPDSPLGAQEGEVVGTPNYMPPEQALGDRESLGSRSDVYSVGAILYQLLSGRAPYALDDERQKPAQILARVVDGPPPPLHTLRSGIPVDLAAVCEKAMSRDPSQRYPDMGAMAADLRAYLEQRVVSAQRVGAWQELWQWAVRHRVTAGAVALALALAIAWAVSR